MVPQHRHSVEFDVESVRREFPILETNIRSKKLVYLDNGATTHKPTSVIDSQTLFYQRQNSNVHRGVHTLSQEATNLYEAARKKIASFINASSSREIVFTKGTTDSINLVANSLASTLHADDEILLSEMEHHSNIVPWQMVAKRTGATIKVIPVLDNGELDMQEFTSLLNSKTKVVSVVHISNALGTINPIQEIISASHSVGAKVIIDAAQSIAHQSLNVQDLDCDFIAFSGHKMYAPTGVGVLYGKLHLLEAMDPYQGGGDMIEMVSFERTTYAPAPSKFEAGTPNIAGAIGMDVAIDFINQLGIRNIAHHEHNLLKYATEKLKAISEVKIIGSAKEKAGAISFVVDGIHPHDIGSLLDRDGVAIRAGHHCAQPLMRRFKVPATNRISFAAYNTMQEINAFVDSLVSIISFFK